MKAVDLVKRVTELGGRLRWRGERRPDGKSAGLSARATLRLVQATTAIARGMQRMPVPPLGPSEKLALGMARDQLRAMHDAAHAAADAGAGAPERALVDLIAETLTLIEGLLSGPAEIAGRPTKGELPEVGEGSARTKIRF